MADRHRYVAFRVDADAPLGSGDLVAELRDRNDWAWLISFDGGHGILRCPHTRKAEAIELLVGLDAVGDVPVEVETLGTSGTIRACRRKFLP